MPTKKKVIINENLKSWERLNAAVIQINDPAQLLKLYAEERKGRARARFLSRIQSRMNRVNAAGKGNAMAGAAK